MKKTYVIVLSMFFTFAFMFSFCISATALSMDTSVESINVNQLAKEYLEISCYTNKSGSEIKNIKKIDTLNDKLRKKYPTLSNVEVSKLIYRCIGESESVIARLPEDKILEALTFTDCIQTTNYIKLKPNGQQVYLSKCDVANELITLDNLTVDGEYFARINNTISSIYEDKNTIVTDSKNGYLRLTTTAYAVGGEKADRSYYIVSAEALWLKEPFFKTQDVLAIASTATYDNSYDDCGYFYELSKEYRVSDGALISRHYVNNEIYKFSGSNNPDDISFEYSTGVVGVALRFNMFESTYSGSEAHDFDYYITAYLRFQCSLYNTDGGIQAAYGHKCVGPDLSVNFTSGSVDFSMSGFNMLDEYYGETLSIYDYV